MQVPDVSVVDPVMCPHASRVTVVELEIVPSKPGTHWHADAAVDPAGLIEDVGQLLHEPEPSEPLNVLAGHALQLPEALSIPVIEPVYPAMQIQSLAAVLAEDVPVYENMGQSRQDDGPSMDLKNPGRHFLHSP